MTKLFDGLGRSVQTQAPAEGGGPTISTTGYDHQCRVYSTDNPYWTTSVAASTSLFVPDNTNTSTDARGVTVTTVYDKLNRKTAVYSGTTSGAQLASWTYDSVKKGLVTASRSYDGSTPGVPGAVYSSTVDSYDVAGNPTSVTTRIPSGAPAFAGTTYTVTYAYNADSSLASKRLPAVGGLPAELVRNGYDAWGRLSSVRGATSILNGTVYAPTGELVQFNRYLSGNSGYSTYSYDPATKQVSGISDNAVFAGSGHVVANRSYTRDLAGNIRSETRSAVYPTAATQKTCYSYDGLRQLSRARTPGGSTSCSTAPSVAALGGASPYWIDYVYDSASGNRTGTTVHAAAGDRTATYAYASAGSARPHAVTKVTGGVGLGVGQYSYDEAGNQTRRPGQSLTYNAVGKLVTVTKTSETLTQIYDADGNLILSNSSTAGASLYLGDTTLSQS